MCNGKSGEANRCREETEAHSAVEDDSRFFLVTGLRQVRVASNRDKFVQKAYGAKLVDCCAVATARSNQTSDVLGALNIAALTLLH